MLDSWAVRAFFEGVAAGEAVARLFADSRERHVPLVMSAVNAGEVRYIVAREVSEQQADDTLESLRRVGIEFVAADWLLTRAAGFKARQRLSFAD